MKLLTKHTKDTNTHKFLKTRQCSGKNGSERWFYLAFPPITWMGYWEHACHPLFCLPYSHLFQKQTFIEPTDCTEGNTHLSSKGTGEWHSQSMPSVARLNASWWSFPPFYIFFLYMHGSLWHQHWDRASQQALPSSLYNFSFFFIKSRKDLFWITFLL